MTQFVHLTDQKRIGSVRRRGLKPHSLRAELAKGVHCTPVSGSLYRTHQWLRELKRRGMRTISAVQFYVPPREIVLVGRFNEQLVAVTASEAAQIFQVHESGLGLEVVVTRAVKPKQIHRIYTPNQVLGWRYYPEAKGNKPFCGCRYCTRGEINAYRVRDD